MRLPLARGPPDPLLSQQIFDTQVTDRRTVQRMFHIESEDTDLQNACSFQNTPTRTNEIAHT
jgi:hypothetical protein